ncbi:MAG: stage V sporulation protein AD [Clostridiales bacterium]|nr:stage V sporulation protein AD [Clostridiales bacterium]MCF8021232.1 stage V sporulation protein AD [Clostridiales bacterium]
MTASKKTGKQTIIFENPPVISAAASIVGPKEGAGPLGETFDKVITDEYYGEQTWEKAEKRLLEETMQMALDKSGMSTGEIDYMLAGDLLNQIISANYAAREMGIPYLGLYGACSTMYEGMILGSVLIDGGFAENVLVGTASHYSTAERQYRSPVEQGIQKPLTSQRTVTGAGVVLLSAQGAGPRITSATVGKVIDLGQGDPMNMGAIMAPAAADTIENHFLDTGRNADFYDVIITGDLGVYGKKLTNKLLKQKGLDITEKYTDCGILIYHPDQDPHAGGSGCACSAVVTCGHIIRRLNNKRINKVLGVGTGALLSPASVSQGETVPGIGHAVVIEKPWGE